MNAQHVFHLCHQIKRSPSGQIHLINEGQHRNLSKTADLKQFSCLCLDAFGRIDHHDGAIGSRERPVGIFAKVLMARRIQYVDHSLFIRELHR